MKKIVSLVLVCVLMLGVMFALTSCGSNISEAYAEKINKAADEKKYYTYEDVLDDLGDDAKDATGELFGVRAGIITASDDKGTITITIADGAATLAVYTAKEEK